jgi:hypothetical protein
MVQKNYIIFLFLLAGLFLTSGCLWFLPEGEVPPNLVGEQNTQAAPDAVPLKDAEAAMSGAIVRTFIRNGLSTQQVPVAFTETSTKQNPSFVNLLYSTGMICIVPSSRTAVFLIDSRLDKGVWVLRLVKPDGTVVMKKTVKYHQNP